MTTLTVSSETPIGQVANAYPHVIPWFYAKDLDICCGGGASLGQAAASRGIAWPEFLDQLLRHIHAPSAQRPVPSWTDGQESDLISYILSHFHEPHRQEIESITAMADKVHQAHAAKEPTMRRLVTAIRQLFNELEPHMQKEELVLFPLILFQAGQLHTPRPPFGPPTPEQPMLMMRHEHVVAGQLLEEIRILTQQFTPPAWACTTVKGLYASLATFDRELRLHIHLENNVLFPMAERRLLGSAE